MKRALLIMQQACIDEGHDFTFKRIKARTVRVVATNNGDTIEMTWEAYKTGLLSIEMGNQGWMHPLGFNPEATAAAELATLARNFKILRAPPRRIRRRTSASARPMRRLTSMS